jgi:hypothetical protein
MLIIPFNSNNLFIEGICSVFSGRLVFKAILFEVFIGKWGYYPFIILDYARAHPSHG